MARRARWLVVHEPGELDAAIAYGDLEDAALQQAECDLGSAVLVDDGIGGQLPDHHGKKLEIDGGAEGFGGVPGEVTNSGEVGGVWVEGQGELFDHVSITSRSGPARSVDHTRAPTRRSLR